MKKNKISNFIMILIIMAMFIGGIAAALLFMPPKNENALGGQFAVNPLPDNHLVGSGGETLCCTITIVCDTVLNHLDDVTPEKIPYIPEDGVILPKTTVDYSEGETVFDVLQRVCEAADIQIEYSWTPMYDSYYIEGINHLYEFDGGPQSGWMYKVDGGFPNYGCSAYTLKDGEDIVWCYTCVGLGEDVGSEKWKG